MMAAFSDDEEIPKDLREAICNRLESWELVDYLDIPIELMVELLEEEILTKIGELEEFVGIERTNDAGTDGTE